MLPLRGLCLGNGGEGAGGAGGGIWRYLCRISGCVVCNTPVILALGDVTLSMLVLRRKFTVSEMLQFLYLSLFGQANYPSISDEGGSLE